MSSPVSQQGRNLWRLCATRRAAAIFDAAFALRLLARLRRWMRARAGAATEAA